MKPMKAVPIPNRTIQVEMEVESTRLLDHCVQVWGYVGDYNVCVYVPVAEAKAAGLIPAEA